MCTYKHVCVRMYIQLSENVASEWSKWKEENELKKLLVKKM